MQVHPGEARKSRGRATAERFAEEHPDVSDPLEDRHTEQQLRHDAEEAKKALSLRTQHVVRVMHEGRVATIELTRDKFEEITKDAALRREPHLEGLRAEMLQTALGFYSELQASLEEDASPGARSQLAEAYARVADFTWELGRQDEALAAHRRVLALVEQVATIMLNRPRAHNALTAEMKTALLAALRRVRCGLAATIVYTWVTPERNRADGQDWFGIHGPAGAATPDSAAFAAGLRRVSGSASRPCPAGGSARAPTPPVGTL